MSNMVIVIGVDEMWFIMRVLVVWDVIPPAEYVYLMSISMVMPRKNERNGLYWYFYSNGGPKKLGFSDF